jgi:hypothetical protein
VVPVTASTAAPVSPLLSRAEAAAYLRRSVRSFERHVQPTLAMVRIGKALFTTATALDEWLRAHGAG